MVKNIFKLKEFVKIKILYFVLLTHLRTCMQDTGDFRVYVLQLHWDMQWSFLFLTKWRCTYGLFFHQMGSIS